ncbi:urease accessory protein UreF [Kribbella sp. NPDC059898]|uniref:urease accessory protein UreF n=1 Tax=Kribbella sp. NPDC059898 TaxID=3346995 RepID=UPI0036492B0C
MSAPELVALMLADGRLPTGGHTQSAGLEPAVRAGLGADGKRLADVADYARDRLRTVTRVEAATAVVTRHLVLTPPTRVERLRPDPPSRGFGSGNAGIHDPDPRLAEGGAAGWEVVGQARADWAGSQVARGVSRPTDAAGWEVVGQARADWAGSQVARGVSRTTDAAGWEVVGRTRAAWAGSQVARGVSRTTDAAGWEVVEGAWGARTSSQVVRGVSRRQGRLLLRVARRVWPAVAEYLPDDAEVPRPIVLGVVAAVNGLSAEQLARVVAYEDAQTVISASLKLLPVDPAEAATWLAGLDDDIERLVKDVAPLTEPDAIPAGGAPLIDLFAHQHATERMRLFHA